ncbi:FKBP-type peptidyl-prolyl cis-trans isomerase [Desulfopila sp. IMCC35006]|uniref:FKBP-type peptidyl-prolyl cis-trans isomerase n=1 Tax=Desulfopila sp. IMCC35006 TaxID=2569542 RepID=UPI0010ABA81B|nr:FKBP-type peptidyl-prolyl cis-trans isomerase [Desulfopila sp. IMCC35006]TKB23403.1 FKBP-type peptidyl-prolyl cis-trans isomerase [Desulfopila sp. IMCC35006]
MKKYLVSAVLGLCIALPAVSQSAPPASFEEKISYSMGFEVGNYFKGAGGDIQQKFLVQGIEDAYKGEKPALTPEEMQTIQKEFAQKMQAKQKVKMEEMKAANHAAGVKFLEENKKKKGVTVTTSGLQYEVLKQGKGDKAKPTDKVKVEYTGTLIDGTEFDSTKAHGEPAQFQVDQVIKGWSEALQLMNVGTKLHLVIPAELAYGENGAAPKIQPNSVLVFDVELLGIEK